MSIFLGFDTSNYTTSVAAVGDTLINLRKIIDVKEGMRGIRQSDGVFAHIKELPRLFGELDIDFSKVSGVGVSTKPRNQEGSYMPVFLAGESFAMVISKALGVPLYTFSHQDGHIMAGIMSGGFYELLDSPFTCVHLSGGTTEILNCEYKNNSFSAEIIGGTKDISAGQLLDRLGVALGMKFPCGKEIDALSLLQGAQVLKIKTSTDGGFINFSGAETKLLSQVGKEKPETLTKSALYTIGKSLEDALSFQNTGRVLFVGGVSSNTYLRWYLSENISAKTYFASCELSSDNAVGIAKLCQMAQKR